MVTERGIEVNPEKVQVIQSMSPPRNLQEVQRLAGRIAALSRFISSPIGRIFTHAEISGQLVKWTIELSEYDIQYEPRAAIKDQALADFLDETKHMEGEDLWKVYVDGSSNSEGCGLGALLISPHGDEIRLAVRLNFRASNNEAEYEVVLIGLRAAKQVGAGRVHLYSDSQLIAQQVNGSYEIKSENFKEYMKAIVEARGFFDEVIFKQIPR
ncbi:uncharacterized protein [Henckelia pumila]|uniref:uncharacterized protein n=1 Tax=Henckelia pumila TaxID=405737 RepID=UPI003C6E7CCC